MPVFIILPRLSLRQRILICKPKIRVQKYLVNKTKDYMYFDPDQSVDQNKLSL